jgi:hypothetical protein
MIFINSNIPFKHIQVIPGYVYLSLTEKYFQYDFDEQREAVTRL